MLRRAVTAVRKRPSSSEDEKAWELNGGDARLLPACCPLAAPMNARAFQKTRAGIRGEGVAASAMNP